jgi:hypothetical protein
MIIRFNRLFMRWSMTLCTFQMIQKYHPNRDQWYGVKGALVQGKALQRRHGPPQACHSCGSVIHPIGEQVDRSHCLYNQQSAIRVERSTDFFRIM